MTGLFLAAAASGGGQQGIYAIATAVGGVVVSIFTVYKNAQKQAQYTGENTGHIQSLSEQIGMLNAQLNELKAQNAGLQTELRIMKELQQKYQEQITPPKRRPRYDDDDEDEPAPAPVKRRRPQYGDEEDDDDERPRRRRQYEDEEEDDERPRRRARYEDEDDEDYESPRRKRPPEPPKKRKKA